MSSATSSTHSLRSQNRGKVSSTTKIAVPNKSKSTPKKKSPAKPKVSKNDHKRQTRLDLKPLKQGDPLGLSKPKNKNKTAEANEQIQISSTFCIESVDKSPLSSFEFSPSDWKSTPGTSCGGGGSGSLRSTQSPRGLLQKKDVVEIETLTISQKSKEEEEEMLKDFDLNGLYGACRGISRFERYERAIRYSIKPQPSEDILQILDKHKGDRSYDTCIWDKNELLRIRT